MKTHYFAGYSNPIKNFVPGICAFETTEKNHSLALHPHSSFGLHPWHSDLCSEIPDNLIDAAHLCPTRNPQQIVDSWLAEDPSVKILIADGANKIALYAK